MSQQPNSQTLIRQSLALVKTSFNHVLIGILAVLPVYIVVQIFVWLVDFVLQTVFDIRGWIGHYWLAAVVFAAVYALLAYIGNEIAKHRQSLVISIFDMLIERVPFLRGVYRVSKKVIEMFRGQGDNRIREVVYVEYPKDGVWCRPTLPTAKAIDMCCISRLRRIRPTALPSSSTNRRS